MIEEKEEEEEDYEKTMVREEIQKRRIRTLGRTKERG